MNKLTLLGCTLFFVVIVASVVFWLKPSAPVGGAQNVRTSSQNLAEDGMTELERTLQDPSALAPLERCAAECAAPWNGFAQRALHLVTQVKSREKSMDQVEDELLKLGTEAMAAADKSGDVQAKSIIYFAAFTATADFVESKEALKFRADSEERLKTLTKSHPKSGLAYETYASYQLRSGAPLEQLMKTYKDCLKADPSNVNCHNNYNAALRTFDVVGCKGSDLKQKLAFYLATTEVQNEDFPLELKDGKSKIYITEAPYLTSDDLAFVSEAKQDPAIEQDVVQIETTADGKKKLEELTQYIGHSMAVVLETAESRLLLLAPTIQGTIKGGRSQISISRGTHGFTNFKTLCPNPMKREVPAELRL